MYVPSPASMPTDPIRQLYWPALADELSQCPPGRLRARGMFTSLCLLPCTFASSGVRECRIIARVRAQCAGEKERVVIVEGLSSELVV